MSSWIKFSIPFLEHMMYTMCFNLLLSYVLKMIATHSGEVMGNIHSVCYTLYKTSINTSISSWRNLNIFFNIGKWTQDLVYSRSMIDQWSSSKATFLFILLLLFVLKFLEVYSALSISISILLCQRTADCLFTSNYPFMYWWDHSLCYLLSTASGNQCNALFP